MHTIALTADFLQTEPKVTFATRVVLAPGLDSRPPVWAI
jgi:hypothetical protein